MYYHVISRLVPPKCAKAAMLNVDIRWDFHFINNSKLLNLFEKNESKYGFLLILIE